MDWKLEDQVNDWVKAEFERIGLENQKDYDVESNMSIYMKEALKGGAKTSIPSTGIAGGGGALAGRPDFNVGKYSVPVIIENKLGIKKHVSIQKDSIKSDLKSIKNYAVNGAIHYARKMIESKKYHEVIAIGISGDSKANIKISVYYVFDTANQPKLADYTTLDFLENETSMNKFLEDVRLTEKEKHQVLIDSRDKLKKYAKELNELMHAHSITANQRVLYISGMILSMQDLKIGEAVVKEGLTPDVLLGSVLDGHHDGEKIVSHIKSYLELKNVPQEKSKLMLSSFSELSKDSDRDKPTDLSPSVAALLSDKASITKQIFTYLYFNIYQSIDSMSGHLDIMGELYSEFLKYALGDGKELGIVLTPPYVTKMMTEILDIRENSKVMDLATGSAGFLISAMETMVSIVEKKYGKNTTEANQKIQHIKENQLLGVELNAEMFTLAATNMILRGDGLTNIQKGSSFDKPPELYSDFQADKLLLNPPFSFKENGLPFVEFGLKHMKLGGQAAIIIQDSAGSGRAVKTIQKILKENQLIASIKMPVDLFAPMAGVQTSIYVIERTGYPHDIQKKVRFIDFRNDGYKRTGRGIREIDRPIERYQDIVQIYKNGKDAEIHNDLWDLDKTIITEEIGLEGKDWNFEQHYKTDTTVVEEDFIKVVGDYLTWEISNLLTGDQSE